VQAMLLTQAVAQEPDGGAGVGAVGVGVGVGVAPPPPPLPLVKAWNAWVKAPPDWLIPLPVEDAVVSPGQPWLSRPSAQNESQGRRVARGTGRSPSLDEPTVRPTPSCGHGRDVR
jgi:hypothetical protein